MRNPLTPEDTVTGVSGLTHLATLPGEGPWRLRVFNGELIAVSPNHAPVVVHGGGRVEELKLQDGTPVTLTIEYPETIKEDGESRSRSEQ